LFERICARFDLLAIQEVQDNLEGLIHLKSRLNESSENKYGMVVSDITGSFPGQSPPPERLAFLFRWDAVERTEIASDITFDRGEVFKTLYRDRMPFWSSFDDYTQDLAAWEIKKIENKQEGKRAPAKPTAHLPSLPSSGSLLACPSASSAPRAWRRTNSSLSMPTCCSASTRMKGTWSSSRS
jgi:hypothetical protein